MGHVAWLRAVAPSQTGEQCKNLGIVSGQHIPLDGEACNPGLLGQDVTADLLDDGLGRRVVNEVLALVLVVDVVANAHELAAVVGARQQYHRDAQKLIDGDALCVRRLGLEDELVHADGDGADEEGVEFLIVVVRGGGADVGKLPLEIWYATRKLATGSRRAE